MDDLQCPERARPCADAAGDALPLKAEVGVDQLERILRADCDAGAAVSALVSVYPEHCTHVVAGLANTFMFPASGDARLAHPPGQVHRCPAAGCGDDCNAKPAGYDSGRTPEHSCSGPGEGAGSDQADATGRTEAGGVKARAQPYLGTFTGPEALHRLVDKTDQGAGGVCGEC